MNTHDIELPPEFQSGNSVPVSQATIKRERMEEILRSAIEADRSKRIAALEARHEEAMSKYDKTKESYHEGYADALDVAIQIISGELWK